MSLNQSGKVTEKSSTKKHTIPSISSWTKSQATKLYETLESPTWAPWLAASVESIGGRADVFSNGQLLLTIDAEPAAMLSTNYIYWDGNPLTLPSWDDVAGDPTTYEQTFDSRGNSLVMMSMNVSPKFQGLKLPSALIEEVKKVAKKIGADNIIGSFRPSAYGIHKLQEVSPLSFEQYVTAKNEDNLPIDPWLRSLHHAQMKQLKVDHKAMQVSVPIKEFEQYKESYHVGDWKEMNGKWECGEVGSWVIDKKLEIATYTESNVWGRIPM